MQDSSGAAPRSHARAGRSSEPARATAQPTEEKTTVEPEWARRALERKAREAAAAQTELAALAAPVISDTAAPSGERARQIRRGSVIAAGVVIAAGALGLWLADDDTPPQREQTSLAARPDAVTERTPRGDEADRIPPPVRTAAAFINSDLAGQSPAERRDTELRTVPFIMYDALPRHQTIETVGHDTPGAGGGQAAWLTGTIEEAGAGTSAVVPEDYPSRRAER